LQSCLTDLETTTLKPLSRADDPDDDISYQTIRTLASCLSELLELWVRSRQGRPLCNLCDLLDCPQQPVCLEALLETIKVLKATKEAFKSRALAELRRKLEVLVASS